MPFMSHSMTRHITRYADQLRHLMLSIPPDASPGQREAACQEEISILARICLVLRVAPDDPYVYGVYFQWVGDPHACASALIIELIRVLTGE